MNWFNAGAVVIAALLAVNSAVFVSRTNGRRTPGSTGMRRRTMSRFDVAVYLAMVASWVVGASLPFVAPHRRLGQLMAHWWSLPSLFAWSTLLVIVALVLRVVYRRVRSPSAGA